MKTNKPATLYFCDNGMVLCEDHLGSSAKATGRDISGQRIKKITIADQQELVDDCGFGYDCERTGCSSHSVSKQLREQKLAQEREANKKRTTEATFSISFSVSMEGSHAVEHPESFQEFVMLKVSQSIKAGKREGLIRDFNGNTVGSFVAKGVLS